MVIVKFCIVFDKPDKTYYPGEMVTGRVKLELNTVERIKSLELKLKGRAKCEWNDRETYHDSEGRSNTRTIRHRETETYLKNTRILIGGRDFDMPMGKHNYPFAVALPEKAPSSFSGSYGGISYYAKAKIMKPMDLNKIERCDFIVKNTLDFTLFPSLREPYKNEKAKNFCCLCCASGPLTVVVLLPKTGFVASESIPITLEVDNASDVDIDAVNIYLERKILWKADGCHKKQNLKIEKLHLDGVKEGESHTWRENFTIPSASSTFPILHSCSLIKIDHELHIEADASGMYCDLDMNIPITIGDIPPSVNLAPQAQAYPNTPYNPGMQSHPSGGIYTNQAPSAYPYSTNNYQNPGYPSNAPFGVPPPQSHLPAHYGHQIPQPGTNVFSNSGSDANNLLPLAPSAPPPS